jgi:glutathione synthase
LEFLQSEASPYFITKPWGGHAGRGVEKWSRSSLEKKINEEGVSGFDILQAYHPQVETLGDRRVMIFLGEILGDFVRIPKEGSHLANLVHGARTALSPISEQERKVAQRVATWSKGVGIDFLGLDFIGGRLTEVNITCPTGVMMLESLLGQSLEDIWLRYFGINR